MARKSCIKYEFWVCGPGLGLRVTKACSDERTFGIITLTVPVLSFPAPCGLVECSPAVCHTIFYTINESSLVPKETRSKLSTEMPVASRKNVKKKGAHTAGWGGGKGGHESLKAARSCKWLAPLCEKSEIQVPV